MTQLHEVVAVEADVRKQTQQLKTALYKMTQKSALYSGLIREYEPLVDGGEQLSPEHKKVQRNLTEDLGAFRTACSRRIDLVATKDLSNCNAKADIIVDGVIVAEQVPVTTLLWLEKELQEVRTEFSALPTLSLDTHWSYDETRQKHLSPEIISIRSQKVQEPLVLVQPTDKHPAQSTMITKDVTVGSWKTQKVSSALPEHEKKALLEKIGKLLNAVQAARVRANTTEVTEKKIADALFDFIGI